MKMNELRDILQKNDVDDEDYSLSENSPPLIETVACLRKIENGYKYYTSDRGEMISEKVFPTEDEACKYFLRLMANDYPGLKKYIS